MKRLFLPHYINLRAGVYSSRSAWHESSCSQVKIPKVSRSAWVPKIHRGTFHSAGLKMSRYVGGNNPQCMLVQRLAGPPLPSKHADSPGSTFDQRCCLTSGVGLNADYQCHFVARCMIMWSQRFYFLKLPVKTKEFTENHISPAPSPNKPSIISCQLLKYISRRQKQLTLSTKCFSNTKL